MSGDASAPAGLIARARAAYWDFSGAARRVIDEQPGDVIALSFLLVVGLLRFVGLTVGSTIASGHTDPALMQGRLFDSLLFLPAGIYIFSLVLDIFCRALGGTGNWTTTRLAVAWSLVVAAPSVLGLGVFDGLTRGADGVALAPPHPVLGFVALALFGLAAYIVSAGLAAAHGFRSPARVLVGMVLGIVLLGALWVGANAAAAYFSAG